METTTGHRAGTWTCPGCQSPYPQDDPALIAAHVRDCDHVDGAGQPLDVTIKFSVVNWYIAKIRSDRLAAATGGLPFRALPGPVEDGFDDEATEQAVTALLESLAEAEGPASADGLEIGDVYDARLDRPRPPSGQCEFCHAADAPLAAVLAADPDQVVCEACHADPRLPTVSLAAVSDSRPAYVLTRGDLARIAGREVTGHEAARIAKAIGNSTAPDAIGDAVWQVCGSPAEPEEDL
jgi:hypothetical protein